MQRGKNKIGIRLQLKSLRSDFKVLLILFLIPALVVSAIILIRIVIGNNDDI